MKNIKERTTEKEKKTENVYKEEKKSKSRRINYKI